MPYTEEDLETDIRSEEMPISSQKRRQPSASIAGKGKTLEDLVNSIVSEEDWECLK